MTTIDATGNPVQSGQYYDYTQSDNGFTKVVIGQVANIKPGKISLSNLKETTYLYTGSICKQIRLIHPEKARTVSSVICFPVDVNQLRTA